MAHATRTFQRQADTRRTGFTLVELLVALLILAVLVALTHGIGSSVTETSRARETRQIQRVLREAMRVYAQTYAAYPTANGEPDSSAVLLEHLRRCEPCGPVLQRLPKLAKFEDTRGRVHLVDAFGSPMLYYHETSHRDTGDLAGRPPMLISHGADPEDLSDDIVSDLN